MKVHLLDGHLVDGGLRLGKAPEQRDGPRLDAVLEARPVDEGCDFGNRTGVVVACVVTRPVDAGRAAGTLPRRAVSVILMVAAARVIVVAAVGRVIVVVGVGRVIVVVARMGGF